MRVTVTVNGTKSFKTLDDNMMLNHPSVVVETAISLAREVAMLAISNADFTEETED